jgi:glutaminase
MIVLDSVEQDQVIDYKKIVTDVYHEVCKLPNDGKIATYIPELANVDANKFGVSLTTIAGQTFSEGDCNERFSIQSISKVFSASLAFSILGDKIWERIGYEPSGSKFNSLIQLELENGIPRNPFINAGALVVADILVSNLERPKNEFLDFVKKLASDKSINYDFAVADSEKNTGFRNAALVNFMKSFGNIENEVEEVLDFYFHMCSISMSAVELSKAFLIYANHGIQPVTKEKILDKSQTKRMNAIMQTCGFYDESGEFAFKVGMPGKSGVGGGISAVLPMEYAVTVWSPRLNEKGNSVYGLNFLEQLTTRSGDSIF